MNGFIPVSMDQNNPLRILDNKLISSDLPVEDIYKLALKYYREKDGAGTFQITYADRLKLVGLTKQIVYGPYSSEKSSDVGYLDVVGSDRRQAWISLGNMTKEDAIKEFVNFLINVCPDFSKYVRDFLAEQQQIDAANGINFGGNDVVLEEELVEGGVVREVELECVELTEVELEHQKHIADDIIRSDSEMRKSQQMESQIRDALNQQTRIQFVQYAKQQSPDSEEQQEALVAQLQEQHYQQYMQHVHSQLIIHQRQQCLQLHALNNSDPASVPLPSLLPTNDVKQQSVSYQSEESGGGVGVGDIFNGEDVGENDLDEIDELKKAEYGLTDEEVEWMKSIDAEERKFRVMEAKKRAARAREAGNTNGEERVVDEGAAILAPSGIENHISSEMDGGYEGDCDKKSLEIIGGGRRKCRDRKIKELNGGDDDDDDDDDEEDDDGMPSFMLGEMPPLIPATLWTRTDIKEFKESVRKHPENVFKVASLSTATIRVPTHENGTSVFWEFATDSYDLGFGVYFEWNISPPNQVSVQISESSDEEDLEEEEGAAAAGAEGSGGTVGGDIEKGGDKNKESGPPTDEIIQIYRRDCHEEVYCGSHIYPGRGVYLLKFDNSYSLWRSKTVYYRVFYSK